MATTTFADIRFEEDVENYRYEGVERDFSEGDVVAIPRHTANKFVNKWEQASWVNGGYEVRDEEYDEVLCKIKNESKGEICGAEKSDGEKCEREKPCPYHDEE